MCKPLAKMVILIVLITLVTLAGACGPAETAVPPTATAVPLPPTDVPPTAVAPTVAPTATTTEVPPSATATSVPPTDTPVPPTGTPIAESRFDGARVTFVNNDGFLLTVGDKRVLIDALYEGYPEGLLKPVVYGQPPFDGVDVLLATHDHHDHFSADLVLRYLRDNPKAVFVSTRSAVSRILTLDDSMQDRLISIRVKEGEREEIVVNDITLEALYISHGEPGLLNLGFVITMGQVTFFHTGDIVADDVPASYLRAYGLRDKQIDVQFVPDFYMTPGGEQPYIWEEVQPRYIIPMHYDSMQPPSELEAAFPNVVVFDDTLESWVLPAPAGAESAAGSGGAVPPGEASLEDTWTNPADGMVMVYVPGGTFQMGSTDAQLDAARALCADYPDDYGKCVQATFEEETPQHAVTLDGFWLARTEVTNAQYAFCVEAGACRPSRLADDPAYNGDDYPVAGIPWQDAADYCAWAGGRLPTEAEWAYAARGPDSALFPWGDAFDCAGGNFWDAGTGCDDGYAEPAPVGSFPRGQSWCGALDMAGNVWEWVADAYGPYPAGDQVNPTGASSGEERILRGGSWGYVPAFVRAAYRYPVPPTADYLAVGFRCAAPAAGQPSTSVDVPLAASPTLDGVLAPGEWDGAVQESLSDGGQLFLMHDGQYLYLGLRAGAKGSGVGSVCVDHGDQVAILHSSAALGTALYEKQEAAWLQTQAFSWHCRNTGNSAAAQKERDDFLQAEGWLANNGRMGVPEEVEYQIVMPETPLRLAVAFLGPPDFDAVATWPRDLGDGCQNITLLSGPVPASLQLSPETWVTMLPVGAPTAGPAPISATTAAQVEKLHLLEGHGGPIVTLRFLADGQHLLSLGGDVSLNLWDVTTGQEVRGLAEPGGTVYNAAFSPDGSLLAVEDPGHDVQLRDTENGQVVQTLRGHTEFVMGLAFSPDGALLATADGRGTIIVWDVKDGQVVHTLSGHTSPVRALAFSSDGALLASGSVEGSQVVKVWDVESGRELFTFSGHSDNVYSLAFSPDDKRLASASGDRTLKLWDMAQGQEIRTFRGHRDRIYSVAYSPDGSLLASGSFDGTIKLWDVESGEELYTLQGHSDLVEPLVFSADGVFLASGSFDTDVIVWGIPH